MILRPFLVLSLVLMACTSRPGEEGEDAAVVPAPETLVTTVTTTAAPVDESTTSSVGERPFLVRPTDCFLGDSSTGTSVSCDVLHTYEVYREAFLDRSIAEFDVEAIEAYAEELCASSLDAYVPTGVASGLGFTYVRPTAASWANEMDPDRVVTCLLFDESGALLTGRAG